MQPSRIKTGRPKFHIRARYIKYDNEIYELDPKGKLIKTDQIQPQHICSNPPNNDIKQNLPVSDTLEEQPKLNPEVFIENNFSYYNEFYQKPSEEFNYYNSFGLNPSEIIIDTSNDCNYELDPFFDPLNDIDYSHLTFGEDL
ncbi:hypothetical protein GPJ56_004678 [Histomonas meleagridis]|uniref:uncharacterized protein n=1 Tax=Histomonas meleagridis TaxID=135588 RepID=UPI00355A7A91|nr:hypothetical protein GPJ56_004678 [Histomonas meleagridis]KAH0797439.1 hypothetical protein GO595_009760 [Histomonas meleagridis]